MNLDDLDLFQLKGSQVTCRRFGVEKNTWQITIPYKSQKGCRWKYASTAREAWGIANTWRNKGY